MPSNAVKGRLHHFDQPLGLDVVGSCRAARAEKGVQMSLRRSLTACVAALGIGAMLMASASVAAPSSSSVTRGGTLRLNASETDYEYLDPALAYDSIGWATLYAVNQMLLNYPDKPASAGGNQLVPEAATGFPTVSKDGKTYTFTIKRGMKFSDGSNVTAAAFARAIVRACHPDQGSPAVAFANNIAGCVAFNEKKGALTGVKAAGQKLTFRLINADPTFLAQIAMPFFAAVKPNMPINPRVRTSIRRRARIGSCRVSPAARSFSSGTSSTRGPGRRTRTASWSRSTPTRSRACCRPRRSGRPRPQRRTRRGERCISRTSSA